MSESSIFKNLQSPCVDHQGCVSCLVVNNEPERVSDLIQRAIGNLTSVEFQHYRTNSSVPYVPVVSTALTYTVIALVVVLVVFIAAVIHSELLSRRKRSQGQEWRKLAQVALGPTHRHQQRQMSRVRTAIRKQPYRTYRVCRH